MEFSIAHRFNEQEQQTASANLLELGKPHVEASDGEIVFLDVDLEKYPGQDMNVTHVEGQPQSAAVVESIASLVAPNFTEMVDKLEENAEEQLQTLGELLKRGNNVIISTNHSDLIDIAVALAAVYCALDKMNYQFKTGIVISKMVAFLGYKLEGNVAPAVEVLQMLCDRIYLTFPRTESVKKSGLHKFFGRDNIDQYNGKVTKDIDGYQDDGSLLLALAPSGSTDKEHPENPKLKIMSGIGRGTAGILTDEKSYTQAMAIYLSGKPVLEFVGVPRAIKSEDEAHEMMDAVGKRLTLRAGIEHSYRREHHSQMLGKTALQD